MEIVGVDHGVFERIDSIPNNHSGVAFGVGVCKCRTRVAMDQSRENDRNLANWQI